MSVRVFCSNLARVAGPEHILAYHQRQERKRLEAEKAEQRRVFIITKPADIEAFYALPSHERDRAMKEHRVRQQ